MMEESEANAFNVIFMAKAPAYLAVIASLLFCFPGAQACPTGQKSLDNDQKWNDFRKSYKAFVPAPQRSVSSIRAAFPLPSPGGQGPLASWGGPDAARWRPEAILANAASEELNQVWSDPGTKDAIVAIPVRMLVSDYHPYGDGQTNSAPSFESWGAIHPPLIAVLQHRKAGGVQVVFRFDRRIVFPRPGVEIAYLKNGQWMRVHLAAPGAVRKAGDGSIQASWTPDPELNWASEIQTKAILVAPAGWNDWFPIFFRHPVAPAEFLLKHVAGPLGKMSDGRPMLDPEGISPVLHPGPGTAFERLQSHHFGAGYNQTPFFNRLIHGLFPNEKGVPTAVGSGWTWLVDKGPIAPFKTLYTCFERRTPGLEASAPGGGVPSGGGWHEIGDPAETIFNSLEPVPIPVGWGTQLPSPGLPSGTFAYQLSDVVTIRLLQPGEALITASGYSDWSYLPGTPVARKNFHWFIFPFPREVCTEEWVHLCKPSKSNSLGLNCGANNPGPGIR